MYNTYKLLSKQHPRPLQVHVLSMPSSWVSLARQLDVFLQDEVLALDYETTGLDIATKDRPVGMGLSNGAHALYIPIPSDPEVYGMLMQWMQTKRWVGWNVPFDGLVYRRDANKRLVWEMDAYAIFRYLATEDFVGQKWSLKTAMVEILGWDQPNTQDLYTWLAERKLPLGEMWQAPVEILGKYCALDAGATFHLYEYFLTILKHHPTLKDYHKNEGLAMSYCLIDQQLIGQKIDRDKLQRYRFQLQTDVVTAAKEFLEHPEVAPHIAEYNRAIVDALALKKPPVYTNTGKISARHQAWSAKFVEAREKNHFNLNSKQQLAWLFTAGLQQIAGVTESGKASVNKKSLQAMGPLGGLILKYVDLTTEMKFVTALVNLSQNGRLHIALKFPGTTTGRCAGGNVG